MSQEHAFEPRLNLQTFGSASGAGGYRLGNLLVWALGLYLLWPLFGHNSPHPMVWGYSGRFLVLLVVVGLGMAAWLVALLRLNGHRQRTLFLVTALVLVAFEGLFRLDVVARHFTPIYHFREITPYLTFSGTREPANPSPAKNGEYRIVMLGGSTVNTGDPALPKALEEIFHAEGRPEVRVYNYGVVSYISRQERLLLDLEVFSVQPDMVIVYDGGNDVYQPYFGDPRPGYPYNWGTFEAGYSMATNRADFRRAVSLVLRSSALLRRLFDDTVFKEDILHLSQLRAEAGYGQDSWRKALADGWLDNWEDMVRLARSRSAKSVFLLQPFLTEKRELSEGEKEIDARYDDIFRNHMHSCYDRMRAGLKGFAAKAPDTVAARDLSRALDDFAGQAFVDVIHVDEPANRHLARKIYEVVRPMVDQDRPLPPPAGGSPADAGLAPGATHEDEQASALPAVEGRSPSAPQVQGVQSRSAFQAPQAGQTAEPQLQQGSGQASPAPIPGAGQRNVSPKPLEPYVFPPAAHGSSGEGDSANAPRPQSAGEANVP